MSEGEVLSREQEMRMHSILDEQISNFKGNQHGRYQSELGAAPDSYHSGFSGNPARKPIFGPLPLRQTRRVQGPSVKSKGS